MMPIYIKNNLFKFKFEEILLAICSIVISVLLSSCEEFVKIDSPRTELIKTTVFASDQTANAAMLEVYYQMQTSGFASGNQSSISFLCSLSSDEQINYYTATPDASIQFQEFNDNDLKPNNIYILGLWSQMYQCIYKANAITEGVEIFSGVSTNLKEQLEGEAKFIRAFCYFYLVNMFGNVPLVVTTDYRTNSVIPRSPVVEVYQQIINDLVDSQSLLREDYSFSNNERVRANRGAATALLARVYLYMEDWENAEVQATSIIDNESQYSLKGLLSDVFLVNNTEAIFQLWSTFRPNERATFRFVNIPNLRAIRPEFVNSFEDGDLREATWISLTPSGYYRTLKYNIVADLPPLQYSTVLRIAEQYLIRAEARAYQNNISGAQADINIIRHRAGLGDTSANDQTSLLLAIEQERKFEFFNEWGHRWLDLKRTNRAEVVLSPIKSQWVETAALYPIPETQILNDPAMKNTQNAGY